MRDIQSAQPYDAWIAQGEWSIRAAQGRIKFDPRPWWMRGSVESFSAQAAKMDREACEQTIAEMKGFITHIQAQQEARGRGDGAWWQKSSRLRADATAKRRVLGNVMSRFIPNGSMNYKSRLERLADIRSAAEAGDVQTAIVGLCDVLSLLWDKDRKNPASPPITLPREEPDR